MLDALANSPDEIWKDVIGWEGLYQVSNQGRVRSLDRVVNNGYKDYLVKGRVLKFRKMKDDRLRVSLCVEGQSRDASVHALVLTAFVGDRPEGYDGCHNDGDVKNNALLNLRWDTKKNNQADRIKHGTMPYGQDCHNSKLTNSQIEAVYIDQRKQKDIAKDYGITQQTVSKIKSGKRWLGCVSPKNRTIKQKNHLARPVKGKNIQTGKEVSYSSAFASKKDGFLPRSVCACCHGANKTPKDIRGSLLMLKRKTPLRAKAPMARKPVKRSLSSTKSAKTRHKAGSGSQMKHKRWRSPAYLAWVRTQPCVVCGALGNVAAHHIKGVLNLSGAGLKAGDEYAMPACDPAVGSFNDCHQQIHSVKALRDQQPAFLTVTLEAAIRVHAGEKRERLQAVLAYIRSQDVL